MRCGYCKGEPACLERKGLFECPICKNTYPKPIGGNEIAYYLELPERSNRKIKELSSKVIAPSEPGKRGRKRGRFNFGEFLNSGKKLTINKREWLKKEKEKGIDVLNPEWTFTGKEWIHEKV
ncbi:MAG: hypothetical protein AABY07_01110 [Nanoarchaeota archaeon]